MKYKPFKEQLAKFIKEGCKDSQVEETYEKLYGKVKK